MAELVHDDVVHELRREVDELVAKAQIAAPGARPPARTDVPDGDLTHLEAVVAIEMPNALSYEIMCGDSVFPIVLDTTREALFARKSPLRLKYPRRVSPDKPFNILCR